MEGETYTIEANAQQPLTLLLSTYEIAIQQSMALAAARDRLQEVNESLEETIRERTAQFITSETRYRRLFEPAKDGILILDAETGMVVDVNPFLLELLGFSHEQLLGKKIWELGFLKDIIANRDNFLELQQKGYVRYEDLPLEKRDGSASAVEVVSNVYMAGDKKVIQCNIRDVTERALARKRIEHLNRVLRAIREVNQLIVRERDPETLIRQTCAILVEHRGCCSAMLILTDDEGKPRTYAHVGISDGFPPMADRLGQGILPPCCERAKSHDGVYLVVGRADVCNACPGLDFCGQFDTMCVALRHGEKTAGFLLVPVEHAPSMEADEQSLFAEVAGDIAFALHGIETEIKRQTSEQTLRTIFESATDGILLADAESGRFVAGNDAICRMLGYSVEEINGLSIADIHPAERLDYVHAQFDRQARGEITLATDIPMRRKDGSIFPADVNSAPVELNGRSHLLGIYRDITVRKRAEEVLRVSEEKYRLLYESSRDAIMILEPPLWKFTSGNPAAIEMFRARDEADFTSHASWEYWPERQPDGSPSQEKARAMIETAIKLGSHFFEWTHRRLDGKDFPATVTLTRMRLKNADLLQATVRDITKERNMEAQLRQSQKLEAIGTLAGGVAHEINNPIMGIMNYAQLIIDRLGPDSPVAEYATEIGKETERVATIVKNLLSFARQDKATHSPACLCDIVEGTLSLIRAVMRHDQVTLEVDVPADLPQIKCRSQQIRQVIMNLLTNARDALNQRYPGHDENKKVLITARRIERDGCPWIRTTVEDHGLGIPEALRERIFEPFFTTKPRDKGTGLGLSISHGIVKDHGGELSLESTVGEFTRFHLDLPLAHEGENGAGETRDAEPGIKKDEGGMTP